MKWFLMIAKMLGMIGLAASLYLLPFSFIAAATVFAVSSAVVVALKIWDMYAIGKLFSTTDRKRFPSILTIIVNVLFVGGSIAAMGVAIFSSYIPLAILPVIPVAALGALIFVNALLPIFTYLSAPDGMNTSDVPNPLTKRMFGVNGFFKAMQSIFGLLAVGHPKDKFYNGVLIFAGVTAVSGTIGLGVGLGMTLGATSAIGAAMVLSVATPVGIGLAIGLGVGVLISAMIVPYMAYRRVSNSGSVLGSRSEPVSNTYGQTCFSLGGHYPPIPDESQLEDNEPELENKASPKTGSRPFDNSHRAGGSPNRRTPPPPVSPVIEGSAQLQLPGLN